MPGNQDAPGQRLGGPMRSGTAIPTNIPIFLRRPEDRAPAKLDIKRPDTPCARPPLPDPDTVIHGGTAPVTPDFLSPNGAAVAPGAPLRAAAPDPAPAQAAAPDSGPVTAAPRRTALPWLARPASADLAEIQPATAAPKTAGDAAPVQSKPHSEVVDLTARRSAGAEPVKIYKDQRAAFDADQDDSDDDDDAAFQVTLPRSVIRQIRVAAAEEGTTHRAIVLRALRAAGVEIPEGADVDRRVLAAKRRHQA